MTTRLRYGMIPYNREEGDIYSGLCFNPDEKEPLPDAMYQETVLLETMYLLSARFNASNAPRECFSQQQYIHLLRPQQLEHTGGP